MAGKGNYVEADLAFPRHPSAAANQYVRHMQDALSQC